MAPDITDTNPEVDRMQIELLRSVSPARRLRLALSISQSVIDLARRGLRESLSDTSPQEVRLRFVEVHYGRELARQVRSYLTRGRS